jgi:autotransporter-associated beta strand protein
MKKRSNPFLVLTLSLVSVSSLPAATLFWDGASSGPDADGGAGTWDLTTNNWDDSATGGADTVWPAVSTGNDDAVFGGAAGIVTIDAGGVAANDITFTVAGYTITGGGLTLDSADPDGPDPLAAPAPVITSGAAATIESKLTGTHGLTKSGNGTLLLTGDNSGLSGPLLVTGVTSGNNGGVRVAGDAAFGVLNSVKIDDGGVLLLDNTTLAASVGIDAKGGGGLAAPRGVIRAVAGTAVVNGDINMSGSIRLGNEGTSTTLNGAVKAPVGSGFNIYFRFASNQGLILTNAANYWEGVSQLAEGSFYFHPGAFPSNTNLWIGQVGACWFETNGNLTGSLGTGAGQVRIGSDNAANNNATQGRGFSARDGALTVNLGPSIVWGSNTLSTENFFATGNLSLAGPNATDTCTFTSDIDLNAANRTVSAVNGTADVDGELSGVISGAAGSILSKSGTGVILLSNANTHPGGTTIAQSQGAVYPLRISNANALGSGPLNLGGGGNNDQARIELTGDITVANNIPILTSRNNDAANFLNISGENTIISNINSGGGGSRVTFQSNEGNLIFTGSIGTRQLNLRGEGNGELRGNIPLQTTYGLNKGGAGTWIVSGNATYAGTTVISEGTLQIGDGGTGGTLPAGDITNDGELVFNRDGELVVAAAIAGGGGLTKRGPGAVTLSGPTIAHSGSTLVEEGTLLITGDATNATGLVTVGDAIGLPGTAILGGTGPVGGSIVLASDGAIAPGTAVGTLGVSGGISGTGGLHIEMDGDAADKLVVAGPLDISGINLKVTVPGNPTKPVYVIVDASGPVTGAAFASKSGLPGDYQVVYNYNDGIDSHNIALVGTPVSNPFESWTAGSGLAGADAAANADPDRDGLDNAVEFVIGGQPNPANPDASSSVLAPRVSGDDNHLIFTYRRTDLAMSQPGIAIGVEYGSDLSGWTAAVAGSGGILINVTDEGYGPGIDKVEVSIPRSLAVGSKLFARLKVTIP